MPPASCYDQSVLHVGFDVLGIQGLQIIANGNALIQLPE